MPILCGIDEVGYGSKLGPLVVTLTAIQTTDININLWDVLSDVVDKKSRKKLCVWDSKRVYNGRIASLEPTSLAFLSLVGKAVGFKDFNSKQLLWYKSVSTDTFEKIPSKEVLINLKKRLEDNGIRFISIDFDVIEPPEFNKGVKSFGNKHLFLYQIIARLINRVLVNYKDSKYCFRVGRLSGRKFYLPLIVESFKGGVLIKQENSRISEYEIKNGTTSIEISFVTDGDSSDFLMGLSSIIGKYVRECSMKLFNNFWSEKVNISRSTAGYGKDVIRFMDEVRPHLEKLGVPEYDILRSK